MEQEPKALLLLLKRSRNSTKSVHTAKDTALNDYLPEYGSVKSAVLNSQEARIFLKRQ